MLRNLIFVIAITTAGAATFSCNSTPEEKDVEHQDDVSSSTLPSNLPLLEIMRGLEIDLAVIAHGIWTQDPEAVREAALRIADHPKVTPEQLSAIKRELGSELGGFVQHDQIVHNTAVELVEAADSSKNLPDLFGIYRRIEQGCMSCHTAFQTRVSEALTGSTDGS